MASLLQKSWAVMITAAILSAGCSSAPEQASSQVGQSAPESGTVSKLKIVASFYPMYEFSRNVAGDKAEVINLVPGGVEPHDWEPTAQDMKRIEEAAVFVYNGAGMESWVDKALGSVKKDKTVIVEATKELELIEGVEEGDGHDHGHEDEHDKEKSKETDKGHVDSGETPRDPHVWLDPVLAQKQVKAIQAALEQADPANKETYKNNADAYIAKLQELDRSFKETLGAVKRKEFVTQHAAFGYLAKRYGLTQVPIAGLSPEQEPAPGQMGEIVKFAKEKQVKTIFFETLAAPKVAETVAKEIGAKTAVLNPIEGLTDEDKAKQLDYIGIMKNNLAALKAGLSE